MTVSKQEKDYALLLSFVGQVRLRFAGVHSLFLALWCIVIKIGGTMRIFTFLMSDVSISCGYLLLQIFFVATVVSAIPWYSLLQMLFFRPMYLHLSLFMTCRCFSACLSCIIASAIYLFHDLQILTSTKLHLQPAYSITWRCFPLKNCILNLLIPRLVDASAPKTTSSIYLF